MFIELTQIRNGKILINLNSVKVVSPRKKDEANTIILFSGGDSAWIEEDYETIKQRIKNLERQK